MRADEPSGLLSLFITKRPVLDFGFWIVDSQFQIVRFRSELSNFEFWMLDSHSLDL
jgi:hypothetical protein